MQMLRQQIDGAMKFLFKSLVWRLRQSTLALGLCICMMASRSLLSQDPTPVAAPQLVTEQPAPVASNVPLQGTGKSGTVGPGDLLDLSVSDCPELTRSFRVDADGSIALPFLARPLQINGLSTGEAGEAIANALRGQGVLRSPIVIASIREYQSNPVSVVGAVNHPLSFELLAPTTLVNAIARAGGLSPTVGSMIIVTRIRLQDGVPTTTVQNVAAASLLSATTPEANLILTGGEEIRVLEAAKFYVAGNVRHPGMWPFQSDTGMSVIKAISMSEGLGLYSSKYAYIYRASQPGQPRTELSFELRKVMERKEPDLELHPDDILYIPQSSGKKMTGQMIAQITGFAQATGSGILILH